MLSNEVLSSGFHRRCRLNMGLPKVGLDIETISGGNYAVLWIGP